MASDPAVPSLPRRVTSALTVALGGLVTRTFLHGMNRVETEGREGFLAVLDGRKDVGGRERGLLTVSNHISVIDDPLMWAVIPQRYFMNRQSVRWTLGSHDICFQTALGTQFFLASQVLPTHRLAYSPYGGPFQPTMTQAIRLLSAGPFTSPTPVHPSISAATTTETSEPLDPFSSPNDTISYTYSTTPTDLIPAPSAYAANRHAWLHVFPEGRIHQHPDRALRYFKWGVARLILESEPCPDVVPIFVEGFEAVMPEGRGWPRWMPRGGKKLRVVFGERV
ncbi:tafazzin, partial [Eremomyces bilateralis CBS 781.70]